MKTRRTIRRFLANPAASILLVLTTAACFDKPTYEGRFCDRYSPCPGDLVCTSRAICERTAPIDGPDGAAPLADASAGAEAPEGMDAGAASDAFSSPDVGSSVSDVGSGRADAGSEPDLGSAAQDAGAPGSDAETPGSDDGGGSDAGCRILVNDAGGYCTVQSAVNAAPSGATISIPIGTFNEDIVVSKPLAIVGAGTFGTVLVGQAAAGAALTISASNVEIAGLRISGNGAGIDVTTGSGISIHDDRIERVTGHAIGVFAASAVIDDVSTDRIAADVAGGRAGHGVLVQSGGTVDIVASDIEGAAGDGVHLEASTVNVRAAPGRSTLIEHNAGAGIYSAATTLLAKPNPNDESGFGTVTVQQNGLTAISIVGGDARVADCTIGGATGSPPQHGLSFTGNGTFHAKRNVVSGASGYGLYCDPSGSSVTCDSNDPNTLSGNVLGPRSPACASSCGN
jgi:hypothetical protein